MDKPGMDKPGMDKPGMDKPGMDKPGMDKPGMDKLEGHKPVMLREVLEALSPSPGQIYLDGTFGGGGYSQAILDRADCSVVAIDRDPAAIGRADAMAQEYGNRFAFFKGRFGEMESLLGSSLPSGLDAVVLDIGVSSFQFDQAERGFSFRFEGPLDMRMENRGETAAEIINTRSRDELADIFYLYGEERNSRKIAAAIVHDRVDKPFITTKDLASLIERITPSPKRDQKIHPATRVFQALRIAVNDELGELERALPAAEKLLKENGRLIVVSFHSLEDRIVKRFFQARSGQAQGGSRHAPSVLKLQDPSFRLEVKSAIKPSRLECETNPRARSARMRVGVRTAFAALAVSDGGL